MAKGVGVSTTHKDYGAYSAKWQRCRDVCAGQDAVYARRETYLPKLADETEAEYIARLHRTPFYNATWRTVAGFVGMLFRKPPTIEVPAKLEEMLKDVTQSGVTFQAFAKDCAREDLEVSRVGVLVDYPRRERDEQGNIVPLTIAEAQAKGLRPVMRQYKAEAIGNWQHSHIANKTVLTQVRLYEVQETPKPGSEFEVDILEVVRVLDLFEGKYRVRIFNRESEEQIGEEVYPLKNGQPLGEIPFYIIGPDDADYQLSDPILIDLVDMNLKHFGVSADYEHGCHFTGLPTAVIHGYRGESFGETGVPKVEKFTIGSTTAWVFPEPQAGAEYLEFTGQGLGSLEKNLDRKEAQMAALGARMLAPEKTGVEAAETLAMRHSGEHSVLGAIAIAVSEGLTRALEMMRDWAGIPGTCKFEINRFFLPRNVDAQTLTAWLAAAQAGKLSDEELFDLMKEADLIDSQKKFADHQAQIDSQEPPAPVPVARDPNAPPANDPTRTPAAA